MPVYEYQCENCGAIIERKQVEYKPEPEPVCSCGHIMNLKLHPVNHSFGWTLSDKSYGIGEHQELVKNV